MYRVVFIVKNRWIKLVEEHPYKRALEILRKTLDLIIVICIRLIITKASLGYHISFRPKGFGRYPIRMNGHLRGFEIKNEIIWRGSLYMLYSSSATRQHFPRIQRYYYYVDINHSWTPHSFSARNTSVPFRKYSFLFYTCRFEECELIGVSPARNY